MATIDLNIDPQDAGPSAASLRRFVNRVMTSVGPVVAAVFFAIIVVNLFYETRTEYFTSKSNYDRTNYAESIKQLRSAGDVELTVSDKTLSLLSAEFGWQYVLLGLGTLYESPQSGLNLIATISLGIFTLFCLRYRTPWYLTFLFLLNPIVIDLVMCQPRSALALAVLMLAHMSGRRIGYLLGGLLAQSIHFSSVIFIAVYVVAQYVSGRLPLYSYNIKKVLVVCAGVLVALFVLLGRALLLSMTGDSRFAVEYGSSTLFYSLFWFCLLFALILLPKYAGKSSWQYYYAVFVLTLFLIFTVTRFYNTRFIALAFPIILNSINDMPPHARYLSYAALFSYQCVQYYYWLFVA